MLTARYSGQRRKVVLLLLCGLTPCLLGGCRKPATGNALGPGGPYGEELEKLHGTWAVVTLEHGAEKSSEAAVKDVRVFIKSRPVECYNYPSTTLVIRNGAHEEEEVTMALAPSKNPKELTLFLNPPAGHLPRGIYEVEGDTLTICLYKRIERDERPKGFATGGDRNVLLMVLKREQ